MAQIIDSIYNLVAKLNRWRSPSLSPSKVKMRSRIHIVFAAKLGTIIPNSLLTASLKHIDKTRRIVVFAT